jgi:hypothetical protein
MPILREISHVMRVNEFPLALHTLPFAEGFPVNGAEVSLNGQLHQREQCRSDLQSLDSFFTSAAMNRHRLTVDICSRVTKG